MTTEKTLSKADLLEMAGELERIMRRLAVSDNEEPVRGSLTLAAMQLKVTTQTLRDAAAATPDFWGDLS